MRKDHDESLSQFEELSTIQEEHESRIL